MTALASLDVSPPGWAQAYRLRWKRRRLLWRSYQSRRNLSALSNKTDVVRPGDILAFSVVRNEIGRLPWFFRHYRRLGVDHFFMVDNGSDDGTVAYLLDQPDVSLWQTNNSYRAARFGLDWLTWLQLRFGHGHWTLMVDADELLIFAHHETRSLRDLTNWLGAQNRAAFGAHLLDLYPKGPLDQQTYGPDEDPVTVLGWFDSGPYRAQRKQPMGNLWVQGGVRERVFFSDCPHRSPTLNKIPLVRWSRRYAYVNSCHSALPRYLNLAYDGPGGTEPSGILLHTKFLPEIVEKSRIEKSRRQHFHDPDLFSAYYDGLIAGPDLWTQESQRYAGWEQLERCGLMNSGGWS